MLVVSDGTLNPWIKYCMSSIEMNCLGIDQVKVVSDTNLKTTESDEVIVDSDVHYIVQPFLHTQYIIMNADKYVDGDFIGIIYPNYIICSSYDVTNGFVDGKPTILCDPYYLIGQQYSEILNWQLSTDHVLQLDFDIPMEYARVLPIFYPRAVFSDLREYLFDILQVDNLVSYLNKIKNNNVPPHFVFSAFNVIGSYLRKFYRDDVNWEVMSTSAKLANYIPPIKSFNDVILDWEDIVFLFEESVGDTKLPVYVRRHLKKMIKTI